jgi:hypothetical protein
VAEKDQDRQTKLFQEQDTERTGKTIQRNRETTTNNGAFESLLSTLPPGSEGIAGMLRNSIDLVDNEGTIIADAVSAGQQIRQTASNVQGELNRMTQRSNTFSETAKGMLDTTYKNRQEHLAKQERFAVEEINRTKNKLVREQKQLLNDDIDTRYASLALSGGFGSSNGLDDVARARQSGETALLDLQAEFSAQAKDAHIKYQGLALQAEEGYTTNMLNVLGALKTDLNNISIRGISNEQTKGTAIANLIQNTTAAVVNERRNLSAQYMSAVKTVQTAAKEEREGKMQRKKDARSYLMDSFTKFEPGSSFRQMAMDLASEAGMDVSSLDINDNSMVAAAKSDKVLEKELIRELSRMTVEGGHSEIGRWAANAAGGRRSSRERIDEAGFLSDDFADGDDEKLNRNIIVAARNGMDVTTGRNMDAAALVQLDVDIITQKMKKFDDSFGGIYKATIESSKKFLKKRDQAWMDLKSDIGLQIADTRNKYAGVAVTEIEQKFLDEFLPNFKFDTVGEMELKLGNIRENATLERLSTFNQMLGHPEAYQTLTGETVEFLEESKRDQQRNQYNDDFFQKNLPSQRGSSSQSDLGEVTSFKIGDRNVSGRHDLQVALIAANNEFFEKTGKNIQINESHRSSERQRELYEKSQRGEIGRAAPPGRSFHEKGLAIDVQNWKEAEQFLRKYGLLNELDDDKGHFSIGEFNPTA